MCFVDHLTMPDFTSDNLGYISALYKTGYLDNNYTTWIWTKGKNKIAIGTSDNCPIYFNKLTDRNIFKPANFKGIEIKEGCVDIIAPNGLIYNGYSVLTSANFSYDESTQTLNILL